MAILREKSQGIMKTTDALRKEIAKHYREELKKFQDDPEYRMVSWN